MVRRVALVVAYGPEARALLQSGFAERLSPDHELLVVTAQPASTAFAGSKEPVLPLPCEAESAAMLRFRARARGVRRRLPSLMAVSLGAERLLGRLIGGGRWASFFTEHSIDAVIAASAAGGRALPALQAASNLGLPTAVLLNSWKDLAKRPELPVRLSALGVAAGGEGAASYRDARRTACYGSLHHAAVRRAPAMPRHELCDAVGLEPDRPVLCYAAAVGDPGEAACIARLVKLLARLPSGPQLLIRTNPMETDAAPYDALARRPGIAVLRPRWEWSRECDWCCPLPADLPWWRATLDHCDIAITRPSSITLDFAAWGKPAVNLVWGRGEELWSAPSYGKIRRLPGAYAAASAERAVELVGDLLRDPPPLPRACDDPVDAAARLIHSAFTDDSAPRRFSAQSSEAAAQ